MLTSMCFTQLKTQFVLTLLPLQEPKTLQGLYSSVRSGYYNLLSSVTCCRHDTAENMFI
jgi:hypothetical protein